MPENHLIDLSFRSSLERPFLNRPEYVTVQRGTMVEWRLNIDSTFFSFFDRYYPFGLTFTVYFDRGTPFEWTKETYRFGAGFPLFPVSGPIILASGSADKPGDYKYGIRIKQENINESIDDDDPYLKVI